MYYLLFSSVSLSVLYIIYRLLYRNESDFKQLRLFLIVSVFVSLLVPLNNFSIKLPVKSAENKEVTRSIEDVNETTASDYYTINKSEKNEDLISNAINWLLLLKIAYLFVAILLIVRILIQIITLTIKYSKSKKVKESGYVLIYNSGFKNSFSFFNWIFINDKDKSEKQLQSVLAHEKIHASQYHSLDIILIELLVSFMWFNPFVWMLKRSMQLVHEYLADEGALKNGIEKYSYQEVLLNMVAEEKLIQITSNFNQSLIKKRMIMITKNKFRQSSSLRILALIPLVFILLVGVSCINGQGVNKDANEITVVVDAGHGGSDPGAKLDDKTIEKDLTLSITKMLKEKAASNKKLHLIFIREKDEFLPLSKRIASDADLLISIHVNSSKDVDRSGIECFVAPDSEYKDKSEKIGELFVTEMNQLNGIKTSLKEANLFVLRESKCPALLLNIGYMSNPNDLSFISNKSNQDLICDKILDTLNQLI